VRILVATDQWSPDVASGAARVAAATARLLAERGHQVTVLSPRVAGLSPVEQSGLLELHRLLRRTPLPQTYADPLDTWRSARRWRNWPDIVIAHQATVGAGVLAAGVRAPLVYVFHASVPLEQGFARRYSSWPNRVASLALHPSFVLLEGIGVRRAAMIFVLSEFSRRLLVDAHPKVSQRVSVVRGGVDTEVFAPREAALNEATRSARGIPASRPFVLTVRRLEPRMGIEALLRACRGLVEAGFHLSLGVAGDGSMRHSLEKLSRQLGLAEAVVFFGRLSENDLRALYAAADLFVLPTMAYEGFGMATLEALASGTPVVGTAVGATPELLAPLDPALISPTADSRDLRDAIATALQRLDPTFRSRCVTYARERFDWRVVIGGWENALECARAEVLE
jgi:glycosyltransferase involved in cell wall biosynthesis